MGSVGSDSHVLVFGDFLGYLRLRGFRIGIDHYLRLHELLDQIGGRCEPQGLKTLLAPIFATDKNQQEQFYQAFDTYFESFQTASAKSTPEVEKRLGPTIDQNEGAVVLNRRRRLYVIATVVAVLSLFTVLLLSNRTRALRQSEPAPLSSSGRAQSEPITESEIDLPAAPLSTSVAEPRVSTPTFIERYGTALQRAATGTPLIVLFFYELYLYKRRKLILQRQRGRKPPLVWPLHIEQGSPKIYESETFYDAARLMRRRQADEFYRLDVEATVAATIESLGYPRFKYRFGSKPPEYLILIDRASFRDHQSSFFDGLAKAFEQEGVYVSRYFYDADPRICCDERGKQCFTLPELHSRSASHRLIVIGTGEQMLNSISGKLASWTTVFTDWQYRGVLTPTPAAQWGLNEISLSNEFIVLPATVEGLLALTDHFDSDTTADVRSWRRNGHPRLVPQLSDNPQATEELREYLGEDAFQWLCTCAVYPELHWDLTLYLGSLPAIGTNLIQEDHLLRLIRLPWFRSGSIPDDMRWLLINELDQKKQRAVRSAIVEQLEKHPPPKESYAADTHRLNLIVQRWLSRRDRKARRELSEVLKDSPRNQLIQDYTLLRFLETSGSALHLILPRQLRRLFFRDSLPQLGLNTGIRVFITLLVMAGIWFGMLPLSKRNISPTSSAATLLGDDLPATPKKQYLAMAPDEQLEFVANEAQHVARMIGDRDGYALPSEVVGKIKLWVDAYARRLDIPKPSGGCNMRHDLDTLLKRASSYAPPVIQAFNGKGVSPQVGLYLAMIEAEYCPCLSAGTGPKGFFQFPSSTALRYGAQDVSEPNDTRPDDRCKIEIIAPIAAQYMKDLIAMFGTGPLSVPLAICSYNSGEGGLSRNLARVLDAARNSDNPERSLWTMVANADLMDDQFQREAIKYVPKFFGAAIVGENPRVFGVDLEPLSTYTQQSTSSIGTMLKPGPGAADIKDMSERLANEMAGKSEYVLDPEMLGQIEVRTSEYVVGGFYSRARPFRDVINDSFINEQDIDPSLGYVMAMSRSTFRLSPNRSNATSPGEGLWQMPLQLAQDAGYIGRCGTATLSDPDQKCAALVAAAYTKALVVNLFDGDTLYAVACFGMTPGDAAKWRDSLPADRRDLWKVITSAQQRELLTRFFAAGIVGQNPQQFGLTTDSPLSNLYPMR